MGIILFNALLAMKTFVDNHVRCFRPLMGIILFNLNDIVFTSDNIIRRCFRPLMGIILFNPVFEITGIY